jgi:hypothetical protein
MEEQIPTQPPVPESKYAPLNLQEFQELKAQLESVKAFLPENLMGPFWEKCNRIRGERINQPCSCKSSAGLWGRCVDELRQFVRDRDAQ